MENLKIKLKVTADAKLDEEVQNELSLDDPELSTARAVLEGSQDEDSEGNELSTDDGGDN